jgi:hypothetical protein
MMPRDYFGCLRDYTPNLLRRNSSLFSIARLITLSAGLAITLVALSVKGRGLDFTASVLCYQGKSTILQDTRMAQIGWSVSAHNQISGMAC